MLLIIAVLFKAALAQQFICDDIWSPLTDLSFNETQYMETSFIIDCIQKLIDKEPTSYQAVSIWNFLVRHFKGASNIPEEVLMTLRWVTPAIKAEDYANLTLGNIDVIENFGLDYNLSKEQLYAIADRVKENFASKVPEDYTSYDLKALKNILCAFKRNEIERIHPSEYKEAAEMIGKLNCMAYVMVGFANLAVKKEAFGPAEFWNKDIIDEVGTVVKYLPKKVLEKLGRS